MADSKSSEKPLGVLLKKNSDENKKGHDGKKVKKHKRQKSDLSDVNVEQQNTPSTGEVLAGSATPEELAKPLPEREHSQDGTKAKPKKKSRLRTLSFRRKKKTDTKRESASSSVESETSSCVAMEAGATVGEVDVKSDEEKERAGTRNVGPSAGENSGDLGLDDKKESTLSDEIDSAADAKSPMSNASSLTVVTPLGSKANSPLPCQETTESQGKMEMSEIGDEFYSLPDDEEIEIPPDTDIPEGIPRPSDLFAELKDKESADENSIAETISAILEHLKAVAFGVDGDGICGGRCGGRCGHVSKITSETYKLGVIALDQSFAKFEGAFNSLLNQAEETTRKIVMYFLASLIEKYPHCFKVCKVKRKKKKSTLKLEAAKQPAQKDTVS